eukprot:15196-Heterococcus_DN1.PRE.1
MISVLHDSCCCVLCCSGHHAYFTVSMHPYAVRASQATSNSCRHCDICFVLLDVSSSDRTHHVAYSANSAWPFLLYNFECGLVALCDCSSSSHTPAAGTTSAALNSRCDGAVAFTITISDKQCASNTLNSDAGYCCVSIAYLLCCVLAVVPLMIASGCNTAVVMSFKPAATST